MNGSDGTRPRATCNARRGRLFSPATNIQVSVMPRKTHEYHVTVEWIGNTGHGTSSYTRYARDYVSYPTRGTPSPTLSTPTHFLHGSADPSFLGDNHRWNPEELLVSSVSACHMLWYLHLCADAGIVVSSYLDHAKGIMETRNDGSGAFTRICLAPAISVQTGADMTLAQELHLRAHEKCFIAASLKTPVEIDPKIVTV